MSASHALGWKGEDIGALYLQKKGYKLVERNYRTRRGEIDLIMLHPAHPLPGMLVFIEVKTRRSGSYGPPVESVTPVKIARIRQTAEHFLQENDTFSEYYCRFDVLGIESKGDLYHIEHIEDAFA